MVALGEIHTMRGETPGARPSYLVKPCWQSPISAVLLENVDVLPGTDHSFS